MCSPERRSGGGFSAGRVVTAAALVVVLLSACGKPDKSSETKKSGADSKQVLSGTITVSAASSLTEAFTELSESFEAANPDTKVVVNFGSSGQLAAQIRNGAPADVAAFADTAPMKQLEDADLVDGSSQIFVRNRLVIVTKPGNPTGIKGVADLANAGVVALCVVDAPCGKFAGQILERAGVTIPGSRITRGTDVKSTLTAVTQGDAVAGFVYATDAAVAAKLVDTVDIPDRLNSIADYPIAVTAGSADPELARAFVSYVTGGDGRAVLENQGFVAQ